MADRRVQCVMVTGSDNIWTLDVAEDERIVGASHEGNLCWVYIEGPPLDGAQ